MKRLLLLGAALSLAATGSIYAAARPLAPIEIGAVYPTGGGQGRGGIDEYRGVRLAAELVNASGGIDGRRLRLRLAPADSSDQVGAAMKRLVSWRVPAILGSYGSTVSRPAAEAAQRARTVFWETGAVGHLGMAASSGDLVFRFSPTGATLGRSAVAFARDVLIPRLGRDPRRLRYGVAFVDDVYGRPVGEGAIAEAQRSGLTLAGSFPYALSRPDYPGLVRTMVARGVNVLFVAAYMDDGVALRKETVRQRLPLVASVGTSSSYCMHEFGVALGADAVGLFASDKPDGHVLSDRRLAPAAAHALRWARREFRRRYEHDMTAPALTGFAGAWALFRHVLPSAQPYTPASIARAARIIRVPQGALPNGSGLAFGSGGRPGAPENLRATSVIWEWVAPQRRAVVWPPSFATQPVIPLTPRRGGS